MASLEFLHVAGVDGCRAGWFVAVASVTTRAGMKDAGTVLEMKRCFVARTFSEVLAETEDCELVCVDIPIGLSEGVQPRQCDIAARQRLGRPRASSVFRPPVKQALLAKDPERASKTNFRCSGKWLSKQSLGILPKIREVDSLMTPELQSRVREIHPEISFWALNGNQPLLKNKKTAPGRSRRRELLKKVFPDVDSILAKVPTGGWAIDDTLDAIVAAWTAAQTVLGKAKTLPDGPACDSRGLRMEILCPSGQDAMSQDWAEQTAAQIIDRGLTEKGICLILGGSDAGKTTLAAAVGKQAAASRAVAIVDADIGQSHIGPPTTVGWAMVNDPILDICDLAVAGLSFVGHVSPVGHLLQLTAAITQCVQQARTAAQLVVIDTPGFISRPPAAALWWTVQRILQPELIIAVQCADELTHILAGLRLLTPKIELLQSPPQIKPKSPPHRREYRLTQFARYFQDACLHKINLSDVAVQPGGGFRHEMLVNRVVGIRGAKGLDLAIGLIENWQPDTNIAVVRAPGIDTQQIRCLVMGDLAIDIADASRIVEPGN